MRSRLGRRSGAACALVFAALVATPASPAAAAPTVNVSSPAAGTVLDASTVKVSGSVPADLVSRASEVTMAVGGQTRRQACASSECPFSWDVTLPRNGSYTLTVSATTQMLVGLVSGPTVEAGPRTFDVSAPAAKPVLDTPRVNEARNVELSWSRNTEPDMLYYALFRKNPGGSDFVGAGKVNQPTSGAKVSFTDTSTSATNGGGYAYQVVAVRRGVRDGDERASVPSGTGTATVPLPPTTTSPTTAPVPGAPAAPGAAGGPTTTAKPGSTAGVDLSGFLSSRSQPVTLSPITVPEPPDTGYAGLLPFGARPGDDIEEGEAEAVLPDDGRSSTSVISRLSPGRPLVPVAGGLVLLLLAMHMRVLNHKVKAAGEADLPVEAVAAMPPPRRTVPTPAPAPALEPELAPEPMPAVYDVEEDWAPTDFDFDFEREPELPLQAEAGLVEEPEPVEEPEDDVVELWAPPDPEPVPDPDEIEVVEVVSSNRRRLARAGSR